jgi:hypothetical protein
VRDGYAAQVERIHTLGQQRPGVQELHVLSVVEQAQGRLDLAGTDAERIVEPVVGKRPVHLKPAVAELPDVAGIHLRTYTKLPRQVRRHVDGGVGHRAAALARVHRQEVVGVGDDEALLEGCVYLDLFAADRHRCLGE